MKKLRTILTISFIALMLGGMTSCEVSRHADNGRHRGWHQRHDRDDHRSGKVIVIEKHHRGDRDDNY
jgi:heme A synthase